MRLSPRLSVTILAQQNHTLGEESAVTANVRFINPDTMSKPPGYTHVVEITGPGRIVYVAGQLGTDLNGKIIGTPGDFRAQAVATFENLKAALAEVGLRFEHVVKLNNYLVDMAHLPIFREVRDNYLNSAAPPASTTIQIPALAREGALLETEAIAVIPAPQAAARSARKSASKSRRSVRKPARKSKSARRRR
jgi:enamine deaminase RidA (YjgF/YER057c/UK114 family)